MRNLRQDRRLASLIRLRGGWRRSFQRGCFRCSRGCQCFLRFMSHLSCLSYLSFMSPLSSRSSLSSLNALSLLNFPNFQYCPRSLQSPSSSQSLHSLPPPHSLLFQFSKSLHYSPVPNSPPQSSLMPLVKSTPVNSAAAFNIPPDRSSWNARGKDDD